jgi:hypothetical protein
MAISVGSSCLGFHSTSLSVVANYAFVVRYAIIPARLKCQVL